MTLLALFGILTISVWRPWGLALSGFAVSAALMLMCAYLVGSRYGVEDVSQRRVQEAEEALERALRAETSEDVIVTGGMPNTATCRPLCLGDDGDTAPPSISDPLDEELLQGASAGFRHGPSQLALPELWTVNHARLDHYHGIALGQAKQSFRNAQVAMGMGFVLLIAFAVAALRADSTTGSVVAGVFGGVSAALAGYVSRTFLRSQEVSAAHLRAYFDQPLEFSRFLAAERLISRARVSDAHRAEITKDLVAAITRQPVPPAPGPDTGPADSSHAP